MERQTVNMDDVKECYALRAGEVVLFSVACSCLQTSYDDSNLVYHLATKRTTSVPA